MAKLVKIITLLFLYVPIAKAQEYASHFEEKIYIQRIDYKIIPPKNTGISVQYYIGKIAHHSPKMIAIPKSYSQGIAFNFEKISKHEKPWMKTYANPSLGLTCIYFNHGDPKVWGSSIGFFPYVNRFWLRTFKVQAFVRMGSGIGWHTKTFHYAQNPNQVNIGSHINNVTSVQFGVQYLFNNATILLTQFGLTHFSNGGMRKPNLGINILSGAIGISHNFYTKTMQWKHQEYTAYSKKLHPFARLGISANEHHTYFGPMTPNYMITVGLSKRLRMASKVMAGIDAAYNTHIASFVYNNENNVKNINLAALKSAMFLSHEFVMGNFGLQTQLGYYVWNNFLVNYPVYFKVGALQYMRLTKKEYPRIFAHVFLKSHFADAEFIETGLGFEF